MSFYDKDFTQLLVENDYQGIKGVLRISLNNPQMRNAISYEMIDSFCSVVKNAQIDPQVKLIVLTGEGKSFCAGGDIKAMKNQEGMFAGDSLELRSRYEQGIQRIPRLLERIEKPIIAAVDGAAIGAGLDLACMCDIRLGSDNAKFAESFVKIGLVPGIGGSFFLSRVLGYSKALELALTGRLVSASEAFEMGLVNHLCSKETLMEETLKVAQEICSNSLEAIKLTKKAYRQAWGGDIQRHLELLSAYQGMVQRSDEHFDRLS